ncbi:hypothetical protein FIBSPDRAFT_951185 [Athelia psychrophila]|uniref:Uncharacterized protein n=1 Tax=Athelia psychrophila TaxID=1759441 RepID=A0A166MX63_9AGAM|nr:hypothetical protein FIBSPDRAFT_951185 [Fibularhizoctonia sp. CBS 109695]
MGVVHDMMSSDLAYSGLIIFNLVLVRQLSKSSPQALGGMESNIAGVSRTRDRDALGRLPILGNFLLCSTCFPICIAVGPSAGMVHIYPPPVDNTYSCNDTQATQQTSYNPQNLKINKLTSTYPYANPIASPVPQKCWNNSPAKHPSPPGHATPSVHRYPT